ncbi:MAG: hypothetical protein N2663_01635 [Chlorobi bacterium]|nr:hypothetical protein [Chlorobiota bacterium]
MILRATLVLLGVLVAELSAQSCCGGAGTFLGGTERAGLGAGMLTAAAVYNFTAMDRTLDGTHTIPNPNGSTASSHALNFEVELSPFERFSVLVVIPFTDKVRTINVTTGSYILSERYHASGIADAFGLIKYSIIAPTPVSPWSLAIGGGAKAPTGNYRVADSGVELPLDVQPGTSSWDALAWSLVSYRFDELSAMAAFSLLVRRPGKNVNGRTMGTDVQALLTVSTTELDFPFVPILLSRWRWTAPDRQGGRTIAATGTFRVELLPAFAMTAWEPLVIRLGLQLPIYERTNGIQLVPTWGVFTEIRTTATLW